MVTSRQTPTRILQCIPASVGLAPMNWKAHVDEEMAYNVHISFSSVFSLELIIHVS